MKKFFRFLAVTVIWIIIWTLISYFVGHEVLLPSPLSVARALFFLMKSADFYLSCGYSLLRILSGFLLGIALGVILGAVTKVSKWLKEFISPLLTIIRATPIASFIILLMVWMNRDFIPVFTSVLIVAPIVCSSFIAGIEQTDRNLIEMATAFGLSRKNRIKKLYIPSVLPYFSSATATSLGMAWKAGTAAEVICNPHFGIGSRLYDSKIYLEVPELFAWTVAVVALSFFLERLLGLVALKINKRRQTDD